MSRNVASSAPVHAPLVRRNDTSPAAARRKPSAPQSVQSRPSAQAAASAATSRVRPSSAGSKRSSGANSSERRARRMRISSILSRPAALAARQPRSQRRFAGLRRAFGANGPVHTPFFAVFLPIYRRFRAAIPAFREAEEAAAFPTLPGNGEAPGDALFMENGKGLRSRAALRAGESRRRPCVSRETASPRGDAVSPTWGKAIRRHVRGARGRQLSLAGRQSGPSPPPCFT